MRRGSPAAFLLFSTLWLGWEGPSFQVHPGPTRKQARSTLRTRGQLPGQVLEIPQEQPREEVHSDHLLLERRAPYSFVAQFPVGHDVAEAREMHRYIEDKLKRSLQNTEDLIRHVEARMKVQQHFHHQEREGHKRPLAPFHLKVIVHLWNQKQVVFANPEKHAQHTFMEAVDHAADGLRKLLREEKDKELKRFRKNGAGDDTWLTDADFVDPMEEAAREDARMEEVYKGLEAAAVGKAPEERGALLAFLLENRR